MCYMLQCATREPFILDIFESIKIINSIETYHDIGKKQRINGYVYVPKSKKRDTYHMVYYIVATNRYLVYC